MTPTERKQKAQLLAHQIIDIAIGAARANPYATPEERATFELAATAVEAYAAACVAEARANLVAWLRAKDARRAGVLPLHYVQIVGLRDCAWQLAYAIEMGMDTGATFDGGSLDCDECREVADELDRLRAENARLRLKQRKLTHYVWAAIRAAGSRDKRHWVRKAAKHFYEYTRWDSRGRAVKP